MSFMNSARAIARPWRAASIAVLCAAVWSAGPVAAAESLSLAAALERAVGQDPSRPGARARASAAEADVRQAGVRPNPSVGFDVENFLGTGPRSLIDGAETTLYYEQTYERGGKRQARVGLAQAELSAVRLRGAVQGLDLLRDVQIAYAEALAAEAHLLIAEARYVATLTAQEDIDRRVKSARDPLFAGARAEAETARAEIARDQARTAARNSKALLAAFWGGSPDFELDLAPFFNVSAAPVAPGGDDGPDLALLAAQRNVAAARVEVERSESVTDPRFRAGARYFQDGGDVALIFGGSIPLQRYDTNRNAVDRAQAERTAAEADMVAAVVSREREIMRLRARLAAYAEESNRLRDEVIPSAQETVKLVRDGFNRGGFQYLDVTEAERLLADTRARRVEVLKSYHLDQAALDRLTARHNGLVAGTESR